MTKRGLDRIDRALIAVLQENARLPTAEIARRLNIARTTVQDRISRLEEEGVLQGYSARVALAPQAPQMPVIRAHLALTLDPARVEPCVQALKSIPAVRTVFAVTGPYQLLAILGAGTTEQLETAIEQTRQLDGVQGVTTSILMGVRFDRR